MISIQYFAIIDIAFENLTLGLNTSGAKATIVVQNILKLADLDLKQIIGRYIFPWLITHTGSSHS